MQNMNLIIIIKWNFMNLIQFLVKDPGKSILKTAEQDLYLRQSTTLFQEPKTCKKQKGLDNRASFILFFTNHTGVIPTSRITDT